MTFLTSTPGNAGILPPEFGALITGPLKDYAIAFDPRVSRTVTTDRHEYRAPLFLSGGSAKWVAEGEEIELSEPKLDEVRIVPAKVGGIRAMSRELVQDSAPSSQELVGAELARALVEKVDTAFFGDLAEPAPKGLGAVSPTIATGALTSLDIFHEAKAAAESQGGRPTALLAHPLDVLKVVKLKTADGSNQGLVSDANTVAGVPVISTEFATEGEPWMVDSSAILTVLREDTAIAVSNDVYFSSDRIALRGTVRVGFGVTRPSALVKILLTTPGA